jgi:ribosomal protein L29
MDYLLIEKHGELKDLRFSAHSGQLKQVHKIKLVKKVIAQILTTLKKTPQETPAGKTK